MLTITPLMRKRFLNMKDDTIYIGIGDKVLSKWLVGKDYISVSDEGEAIGVAGGYWLATGKKATVFMSADGFMNAMNFLTSWAIPDDIGMDIVISYGRMEKSHFIATELIKDLIEKLKTYDAKNISYKLMKN